jgi:hypothetical protein
MQSVSEISVRLFIRGHIHHFPYSGAVRAQAAQNLEADILQYDSSSSHVQRISENIHRKTWQGGGLLLSDALQSGRKELTF